MYFNSNQYHGDQFVTDEALSAGYTNEFVSRDPQLLTKGINALINVKAERILALAEDDLLRLLLNFPAARVSLPRIMDISRSSGSHELINWTMPEKEWLFECLISDDPALTSFGRGNLVDFRAYLACQEGALPGVISNFNDRTKNDAAMQGSTDYGSDKQDVDDENETIVFSTEAEPWQRKGSESKLQGTLETSRVDVSPVPTNMQSETVLHQGQSGKLDHFFHDFPSQEYDFAFASDEKAELRVQETYFTLLWSSSILRLSRKQEEMTLVAVKSLSADKPALLDDTMENMTICTNKAMILDSDEDDKYQSFRADIQKATEQVRLFSDTLRGLSSRLVTKAMPEEGSLTNKWHDDYSGLCARLTKHMQELDSWSIPDEEEINDDDTYETTLERAQVEWGDLYEDDQIWSSNDVVPVQSVPPGGIGLVQTGDDKESIDVFSQRINQDWGWLEEWTPVPQQRDENAGPYEFDEQEWDRYFLGDS